MSHYHIKTQEDYKAAYQHAIERPEEFWKGIADNYQWRKPWKTLLEWEFTTPNIKWFKGGKLNITENCLDRHLKDRADDIALIWEPNNPKEREVRLTYQELHDEVCRFANVLKKTGVKKGDRVAVYMPMIPELTIGVLACARIGAVHSVVFAGFSANALADRINDSQCVCVLTSDGMFRGEKSLSVKTTVDEALLQCGSVHSVIVVQRDGRDTDMLLGRDYWYHEEVTGVKKSCHAEEMDAEDLLFILYTSGSTGKPKGVVHTCGGYMVYAGYSFQNVFQYQRGDVYWCTADVGWITGHSYIIYGPLLNGATTLMFEGVPTWPDAGRFWEICDKYQVNQFYTAPTAIRALMACGNEFVERANLDSLKVIGSVGEPINTEAWQWYHEKVGHKNCPIVDTWWQTETGGIMISGLGGISDQRPTYAGQPLPGVQPVLLDNDGNEIEGDGVEGYLGIKYPWPSMIRTTYGDHERCKNVYFSTYKGYYFTGDGARREDGMYRIIGRVDDVINVSGHRFGTAEIENAINASHFVTESAVVGYPHEIKGQGIYAYVILENGDHQAAEVHRSIIEQIVLEIGPIAKPDVIQIVPGLPKTRSGKIMRRILRKIAERDTTNLGDTSTLLDPSVVEEIKAGALELLF
ncbi:MAG: acetate--CoA ligase [Flavobacteriales bacterium]|jgi:acetyl-CoA synthetase|tara:strand:+ start:159 stop:2066 length:1908 start_codon:yes stop_codon:yes gene_type:complete